MTEKEFIHLATALRQKALGISRGYGLGPETAEDVAQDAMLKLWSVKDHILSEQHAQGAIVRISRHLCIDIFRLQKGRVPNVPIDAQPFDKTVSHYTPPDILLENDDNERWLTNKLKELPTNQYLVLHLRQVEKKSIEEIADIVGVTAGSVGTLLARARRKMLEEIRKKKL